SVERGRPRGIYAAGAEEPNAYLRVRYPDGTIEPFIRATQVELTAGLQAWSTHGKATLGDDPDPNPTTAEPQPRYDKVYAHCDVLVIGAGPAGLSAALAAGRTGARVMLVDDQPELGGSLLSDPAPSAPGESESASAPGSEGSARQESASSSTTTAP